MADKPKSFEDFFYTETNCICNIEIVSDYADKHERDYTLYKGFMLCPECQKAKLTFVRKSSIRRAHLKKIPSSNHLEDCSYNYEYASKRLIKKYVDDLNYNQVQDRLNAIMNMLCSNKQKKESSPSNGGVKNTAYSNPLLIPYVVKESTNLKALRRKRLAGWIDESDGTDLHIFYGKVKLSVEEKMRINKEGEEYSYYLLNIKTKNKNGEWKYRTSIYRGKVKNIVDEVKTYQIAMIGNLNFNYKWWKIDLINRNAIRYQEMSN